MLDNEMLITSVEFMFFSNNVKTGIIYSYDIVKTSIGRFKISKDVQIFLPINYNTSRFSTIVKMVVLALFYITLLVMTVHRSMILYDKFRSMFFYKLNEFWSSDITTIMQIFLGILLAIYGIYLFVSPAYNFGTFRLPINEEEEFTKWVEWANAFRVYRIILGLYGMDQVLNFLLVAAGNFPSLGILFETIGRSRFDMLSFTMVVMLLFLTFVSLCYLLFG